MKLPYRKEIDGLRAIAVISIVLFHAGFKGFEGGYVGVDIFFVISGFLISSIIIQDYRQGTFSFASFYERRARRLLPALFFVLLATLPFAWLGMLPGEITEFSRSLLSVLFFISNFFFWDASGYFATAAEYRPLLHTWSLAVEEQFYLLFPIVFIAVLWLARSAVAGVLALLGIASFVFSLWASVYKPTLAFFLLPTRVWEFMVGALAALFVLSQHFQKIDRHTVLASIASLLGLCLILYSIFVFKKNFVYPGYLAAIPVCGTALLLIFCRQQSLLGAVLGAKPIVMLGLISYSTYLWHQPLFAFARLRELDPLTPTLSWVLVATSFGLGYLTWRLLEPIWRLKQNTPKRSFWWFIAFCACTFILFFLVVKHTGGYLFRFNHLPKDYFQTAWINYKFYGLNNQKCYTDVMLPCAVASFPEQNKNILIVGDSHTGDFGGAFTEYLEANRISGSMFSVLGCGYLSKMKDSPSNTNCGHSRTLLLEMARKKVFSTYLVVSAGELHTPAEVTEFTALMTDLLNTGAEVILFEPRARFNYDPKKAGVLKQNSKNSVVLFAPELTKDWDAALTELRAHSNFKIFDQAQALLDLGCGRVDCFKGHTSDGHLIYRDPTHLTDLGAREVFKRFSAWYPTVQQP